MNCDFQKKIKGDIILARQCMNFQLITCKNKECKNETCPLNKIHDAVHAKGEEQ